MYRHNFWVFLYIVRFPYASRMWQLLNRNEYTTRGQNKVYCVFIYMHFSIFDKSLIKTKTKLERLLCWLMKTNADAVYFSTNWIFCLFYTIFENHSSQSLALLVFFRHNCILGQKYVNWRMEHNDEVRAKRDPSLFPFTKTPSYYPFLRFFLASTA